MVNGWLQYAHPQHADRASNGNVRVPGVNDDPRGRYAIVKRLPAEGRVLHAAPYRRILAPSGLIYLVDRGVRS